MVGSCARRVVEQLCGAHQLSLAGSVRALREALVASGATPPLSKGLPLLGLAATAGGYPLAHSDHSTPVAEPTTGRYSDPREEPDALTGASGSVRGASGNRRSYRDKTSWICSPTARSASTGGPTSSGCCWPHWPTR